MTKLRCSMKQIRMGGLHLFFADNKLTDVLEIEGDDLKLEFAKLYKNIDWPETISNLLGFPPLRDLSRHIRSTRR